MSIDYFTVKVYFFTVFGGMMRFSYYAFSDAPGLNACSKYSDEAPLVVNCAGNIVIDKPFTTDNVQGREDFYLMYVIRGQIGVFFDGAEKTANPGDVLLFPPYFRYRYSYYGNEALEYLFVHFTGSYAEQFLEICALSPLPCMHSTNGDRRISDGFCKLLECTENALPLQKYELASILEQTLLAIAGHVKMRSSVRNFEKSLRIMHTSYHSNIRIPDLAKAENLSNSRFIELFRRQMGMSPMAYLIRLRIQTACTLLETTDMPISQIARMVSYEDAHFFSKIFNKHVGLSPTEYRKNVYNKYK